ncbi:uncharacterized protein LOC135136952 [Zophobas morio]|uniref:uncharacterized protein LOC135136952 n=1 Tax=Zophobas morio TaxID=2755281 RepID=UPI0030835AEB
MSNLLTIEDCDIIVRKCLQTETAKTLDYSVVNLQKQNFLVEIATANKTLNFFAKSGHQSATINHIVDEFNTTVPNFDTKITPQLYFTKSDFFVFEDLSWQGFKNYNPESSFAPDHVKTVLKVLAKLHAGSFAYEEIKTKQTQKVYRLNQDYKLKSSSVDLQKPEVTKLISSLLGSSEVVKNLEDRQSSTIFRRALCHGNVTFDNVMFKDPTDCKLIDFESIAYAPPAVDVLQTIFFNCGEDQRQHYYHSFLAYYYDCLNVELNNYGVKIDDIVTIEEWQAQIHQFLPLIKLQCLQINQLVSPDELKEDLTSSLLSRQDCYAIIAKKLKTTIYHLLSFKVTHIDSISAFLGDYYRLQIKLRHQADINCFVKRVPKSTAAKNVVSDSNSFVKEAFVYNTLIPKFEQLGINMITDCLPPCYFHRPNDILVFEDMNALDYQVTSALDPHDFDTLCLIVKKVAKFHASAFVYEEKMSEELGHRYRLSDEFGENK